MRTLALDRQRRGTAPHVPWDSPPSPPAQGSPAITLINTVPSGGLTSGSWAGPCPFTARRRSLGVTQRECSHGGAWGHPGPACAGGQLQGSESSPPRAIRASKPAPEALRLKQSARAVFFSLFRDLTLAGY